MLLLLVVHAALALLAPVVVRRLGRKGFFGLALAPAAAAVWALTRTRAVLAGDGPVETVAWVPALDIELAFRLDTLSWLMVVVVGGVGALVLVYCAAYFSATASGLGRFGGVLVAFAGAMLGLVTTDDLLMLYVFWELTTVFSYLLIGHYSDRKASRRAAMQAIVLTTAGGLAMFVGLVVLGETGSYRLSELLADPPTGSAVTAAVVLVLVGAVSKSALVPLHFWLPAAMAAPTPVSAYLHAAAMVKAGIYLVARFAPGFSDLGVWTAIVSVLGTWTLVHGGYRALRQYDLKLVLAFGTVSQLGLLVLLVGLGSQATALAGLAMLGAHAMFKAALFLVVGVVDAATGTRDLRRLSGVGRALPVTAAAGALATLSMVGMWPFAGFVAKEAALEALLHEAGTLGGALVLAGVVVGSMLTVAYGLRFWWGAFASKPTADDDEPVTVTRPSLVLVAPAAVLALLGLVLALVPGTGEELLTPHAATYPGEAGHLVLWAGFTPALGLSALVLTAGAALFVARARVERLQARVAVPLEADLVYRRAMRRLDDAAADLTALTQRGSLPFYLGVILVTLVVLQSVALVGAPAPSWADVRLWDRPAQVVVGALAVAGAVLAANSRRRLKAVVLAGVSGYAIAALFMLHGAPDLALTQVLVETITLVVFVLVLRRLPAYFSVRPLAASRWVRLVIGAAAGVVVAGMALVAPTARVHTPVSADFAEEAYVFGGGRNIVNVTLVDIRAWDTMGEIAVLLVAATGVASLIFLLTRSGSRFRSADARGTGYVWAGVPDRTAALRRLGGRPAVGGRDREWLRAGSTLAPQRRSVIFEIATRMLFHSMVLAGLYLLFAGHNSPGGGFAGGLVVGVALIVRYLAGGRYELGEAAPVHPGLLLGLGLFLSAGVGLLAILAGGSLLESVIVEFAVPVLGPVKLVTSVFFDIGVFLLVIGLVLDVLRSLGAEIDRHTEDAAPDASDPDAVDRDDDGDPGGAGTPMHRTTTEAAGAVATGTGTREGGR
ncbi:Na+/H+ antiporter subunit A [Cellulomonas carbonis]|uniref:Monovalent cation/H+ antiporter subunit A n=1 Tax=Cellulomonas carbonis T26 TaxID=947969 RepID=A0A0A0BSI7_9CELL|nr:Na+/H+ antiporter subunit A [Cellulomonas carbonis]KGM10880.1 monovalent cation/H+ antiporter subunit A [Cellulomonas carbonis T26]GGC00382.1 monovalent cation/H+ antiporter subunit A [Cellulomonas carbonis]